MNLPLYSHLFQLFSLNKLTLSNPTTTLAVSGRLRSSKREEAGVIRNGADDDDDDTIGKWAGRQTKRREWKKKRVKCFFWISLGYKYIFTRPPLKNRQQLIEGEFLSKLVRFRVSIWKYEDFGSEYEIKKNFSPDTKKPLIYKVGTHGLNLLFIKWVHKALIYQDILLKNPKLKIWFMMDLTKSKILLKFVRTSLMGNTYMSLARAFRA